MAVYFPPEFQKFKAVIQHLIQVVLSLSSSLPLRAKIQQFGPDLAKLLGISPALLSDIAGILNWDFDALVGLIEPVVVIDSLILKNMAYEIKGIGERKALEERTQ